MDAWTPETTVPRCRPSDFDRADGVCQERSTMSGEEEDAERPEVEDHEKRSGRAHGICARGARDVAGRGHQARSADAAGHREEARCQAGETGGHQARSRQTHHPVHRQARDQVRCQACSGEARGHGDEAPEHQADHARRRQTHHAEHRRHAQTGDEAAIHHQAAILVGGVRRPAGARSTERRPLPHACRTLPPASWRGAPRASQAIGRSRINPSSAHAACASGAA